MKQLLFCLTFFSVFLFATFFYGCSNHYSAGKVVDRVSSFPGKISTAQKEKRYFIMQSGVNIYSITSVDLDKDKQQMTVTLDKVDSSHLMFIKNPEIRRTVAKAGDNNNNETIYLTMKDSTSYTLDEPHTIPIKTINRILMVN